MQTPGDCMWVEKIKKQFCCKAGLTKSDCEIELDWFIEDNKEAQENKERKAEAAELNETAGTII